MKSIFIFCLISLFTGMLLAQDRMWQTLAKTKISYVKDNKLGYMVMYPTFPPEIQQLEGTEITIRGYIVPMDEGMGFFALSALPYQSCFFCGKAGIETVLEIHMAKGQTARYTQHAVTMRGTLTLNDSDLTTHLMYILNDTKVIE